MITLSAIGKHSGADPVRAPMLCAVALARGFTPVGYGLGNAVPPVRSQFRAEAAVIVECTPGGYVKRIDTNTGFEKEADVSVSFVVKRDPDPRVGSASNSVHIRCVGGDGSLEKPSQPVCGCQSAGGRPLDSSEGGRSPGTAPDGARSAGRGAERAARPLCLPRHACTARSAHPDALFHRLLSRSVTPSRTAPDARLPGTSGSTPR